MLLDTKSMHLPVMVKEVIKYLDLKPGTKIIDCNIGEGGHSKEIIKRIGRGGRLLGIDRDREAIASARKNLSKFESQIKFVNGSFDSLSEIALSNDFTDVSGILFDLGLSSRQIETPGRGFSWRRDETLDMRMDQTKGLTAAELLQAASKEDLINILRDYGEIKFAPRLASRIVKEREQGRLETTGQLAALVSELSPAVKRKRRLHSATKVFQALRIAVNDEIKQLTETLPQALSLLRPGGRIVIISFHSLEDRIAKKWLKQESKDCICNKEVPVCRCLHKSQIKILTKHPITPSESEIKNNPRSRSAKLRAGEKISN